MRKIGITSLVFFVMLALLTPASLAEDVNVDDKEAVENIEINETQQTEANEVIDNEIELEIEEETVNEVDVNQDTTTPTNSDNPVLLTNETNEINNNNESVLNTTVAKIGTTEYSDLKEAIDAAVEGDVIVLVASANVFAPIIVSKTIMITSETAETHFEVNADSTFDKSGSNQSLFTAADGATLTLKNISVNSAPKYGVQAYVNGTVIIDCVSLKDNNFGGILVNGGKVILEGSVTIEGNSPTGIELGKGNSVTNEPSIELKGEFNTTLPMDKFIYIDRAQVTEISDLLITAGAGSNYVVETTNDGFVIKKDGVVVATPSLPNGKILVEINGTITTGFDTLEEAFMSAPEGSVLILQENLDVAAPIVVERNIILDGNDKTLNATYTGGSGNQTVLTFKKAATVNNLTISGSPKYGIQVYGQDAVVTIDNVQFDNNKFGALLINGGTAKVSNVKFIGQSTGIEIGRGGDMTSTSNLEILGEIVAENAKNAIYVDLSQVTHYDQSKITSTFYDVATDAKGLISLKKDGTVVFEVPGNIKETTPPTPSTPNNTTGTTTWDDGGPFTTDNCGTIYDRWGNVMYKAPYCKVSTGYQVPNTGVR